MKVVAGPYTSEDGRYYGEKLEKANALIASLERLLDLADDLAEALRRDIGDGDAPAVIDYLAAYQVEREQQKRRNSHE